MSSTAYGCCCLLLQKSLGKQGLKLITSKPILNINIQVAKESRKTRIETLYNYYIYEIDFNIRLQKSLGKQGLKLPSCILLVFIDPSCKRV